jgi:hypothetical protein
MAVRLLESIFELIGGSMSPTLERGWYVQVKPVDRPLEPGDVILIDSVGKPVIHRYLGSVTWGSPPLVHVLHAGDSSALPGIVPASRVRGLVSGVVLPAGQTMTSSRDLARSIRWRHARFLALCQAFAILRRSAEVIPGLRRLPIAAFGRVSRRLLRIG